jgi:hypothetical protein
MRRSGKLRHEAGNCLAIALREKQPEMAALLIDEAARLASRARELDAECVGSAVDIDRLRAADETQAPRRQPADGSADG